MKWDESKHPREPSGSEKGGQFKSNAAEPRTYRQNASYAEILKAEREDKYAPYRDKTIDELKAMSTARTNDKKNIPFDFFGSKENRDGVDTGNGDIPKPPAEAFGFANKERLYTEHHIRHAKEMGFKDQKKYERAAIEFWNKGNGTTYYSPSRKRFYLYNEKTCYFLAVSSDGIIHTFMLKSSKEFSKSRIQENLYVY